MSKETYIREKRCVYIWKVSLEICIYTDLCMYKSLFSAVNGNTQKKPYTYEKKSVSFQKETYGRDFSFRVMQAKRETIISLKRLFIYIHISFHVCRSLLTLAGKGRIHMKRNLCHFKRDLWKRLLFSYIYRSLFTYVGLFWHCNVNVNVNVNVNENVVNVLQVRVPMKLRAWTFGACPMQSLIGVKSTTTTSSQAIYDSEILWIRIYIYIYVYIYIYICIYIYS